MAETDSSPAKRLPASAGRAHLALRLLTTMVSGLAAGMIAAWPQSSGVFPVGIGSLAAGAILAVLLVGSMAILSLGVPRWPAALLASAAAVASQHYSLYVAAMRVLQKAVAAQPAAEVFRPGWAEQSFWQFMQREATPEMAAYWLLDAGLLAAAAVVIVEYNARRRAATAASAASPH